ncbi:MAG: cation:dicarboxylase symporter family transporter [Chlamydiae bacterium]|nr:cation:dicarboxylase symporter family transporter [Chlamydiota bacterium]
MVFFRLSFPLQMALATILGILVGLFLGEICSVFSPWADAYIMILKITAIPYLITAIIHGIGQLNSGQAKQIFKKGVFFLALALFINISMIYLVKWVLPKHPGGMQLGKVQKEIPSLNFAELLIPDNVFYDLANNIVPAVVVFSLLIGIALMHLPDKQTIMTSLQTALDALTRITKWISRITPIGTFIIMANQAGTVQFSTVKQIGTYIILYILAASIVVFWIVPRIASMLTSVKSYEWLKNLIPVLVLAYTTNLVIVAIPYIISIIQKQMQQLFPKDENVQSQIQGTVSIVFNMPLGSIYISIFIFFISIFYASQLTSQSQIELFLTIFLTGLGAIGLGSWINNLTFILDTLSLPIDAINFYLASLPFTAGFQSMISAMLISTLSFLITLACRSLITINWKKIILDSLLTILPILGIFALIKNYNPLPHIKNDIKSIYDMKIDSNIKVSTYAKGSRSPSADIKPNEDTLSRILRTKRLRIGYDPQVAPFCFYNKQKQLVGYDIAFAYELAYDLGCDLEFIPLDYSQIGREINEQKYDIGMSSISVSEERLKQICFPAIYIEAQIVLISKDKMRKKFSSLDYVKNTKDLKIAVLQGTIFEEIAKREFPDHPLILLKNYDDFDIEPNIADILLWDEQEAIAWTILHPAFHVIFPSPIIGKDSLGYAVKADESRFLCYLNGWLKLKNNEGFTQHQYDLWILGKTDIIAETEPRFSIVRDVFHWVD